MTAPPPEAVLRSVREVLVDDRGAPLAGEPLLYTRQGDGPISPVSDADTGWLERLLAERTEDREVFPADDGRVVVLAAPTEAGEVFCVVPVTDAANADAVVRRMSAVAAGTRLWESVAGAHLSETVTRLRAEVGLVDTLHTVGTRLTAQLDIDQMVQEATDAATTATGAAFGAFFYNLVDRYGESYTLYTLSGAPRSAFSRFPMPRNTQVFAPTFDGAGTLRSDDIVADRRFGHNAPHHGMPPGHLPVRSYLAVPVVSPTSGEVLGGFFFGHPEPARFTDRHEYLAEGIAGYAAIALDNARLFDKERNLATELSRSMLPVLPEIPHLRVVTRYLPAATGVKVGGDWFDVVELPSGRTAFVIGDVVGHGVTAAAVMGQVRTAIRSYALLELPPSELLRNVSQLTATVADTSFVTCFYAVHDPEDDTLTYANAGHLPAVLLLPDGGQEQIGEALAQPLGIGREFPQRTHVFPRGADLVLYTDGLVESRTRDLEVGISNLLRELVALHGTTDPEAAWDHVVDQLTGGAHDDDIALIHVHNLGVDRDDRHWRVEANADRIVRVREELGAWATGAGIPDEQRDDLVLATYEALANSTEHAYQNRGNGVIDVRVRRGTDSVTVTVTDHGTWRPPQSSDGLRGRGLALIRALARDAEVTSTDTGTTVRMTWSVPTPDGRAAAPT